MTSEPTIDAMGQTAAMINSQGPVTVVLALFIIIFLVVSYYLVAQNRSYQKANNDSIQKLVDAIVEQNTRLANAKKDEQKKHPYEERNLMDIFLKLNSRLREDCKDALDILHADRTSIYAFHNGASSTHGLPFVKFSCICEYISRGSGSRSKMKAHNNIPLNLLDDVMNILWKDGHYEYYTDSEKDQNSFISKLLLQDEDKTCIFYTIYDMDNKIIGFILTEFSEASFTTEELKEKKKYLKYLADKISPIMEFSNYQKETEKDGGY